MISVLNIMEKAQQLSKERLLKQERMDKYKDVYNQIQMDVIDLAGGKTYNDLRNIQAYVKKHLHIRTKRVDWRTRDGVMLWFCENWAQISPFLERGKQPKSTPSTRVQYVPRTEREQNMQHIEVLEDYFCTFEDDSCALTYCPAQCGATVNV